MSNKLLKELKFRIDKHYNNEAKIMLDIVKGDLSKEELKELTNFMNTHRFAKVCDLFQIKNEEVN